MPAKQAGTKSTAGRGRASTSKTGAAASSSTGAGSKRARRGRSSAADRAEDVEEVGSDEGGGGADDDEAEEEEDQQKTIPPELLTRLLHEFFEKDGTRVTRDANAAVARYMDIFVREAIARSAAERDGKFMEVEDLEKVAPQLLLDL
ncbi:CENP-S associating centromere protein X-domain-containing protein [Phialemonium atrogriseum]|uniref:CENP-S associating centromere protein X-domain-containing protein n=1 Tax=Phialemonium atrogriseum TaxID=1093897 RepID=A0AAJ0CC56_9PEZI|nr:CENP-S associating centromere protein X-domain-containing protein [Phialemonium atrogriseum]KAK1772773.1 CENP-S associating centromere protein X-domain-containing protein [Phialemonium atrogriseum]